MKRATLAKIVSISISLLLALAAAEGFLRLYFRYRTNYDIEMWRYAVQLKQAVPDRRSHIHVPSKSAHLMNVDVQINSHGLRDREIPYEKPKGVKRILAIGDSVTFGWGVPLDKSLSRLIETKLGNGFEVLNLGVGNYNTEQELETYLLEGAKYDPDAVLLFYHITDAEPTQKHTLNAFTRWSYVYAFLVQRYSQLRPYFDKSTHYVQFYQDLYRGESWEKFKPILNEFVDATRARHTRLIVVVLPELRSLEKYPFKEYHSKMSEYLTRQGIDVIDLLPDFEGKKSSEHMVARDDPHPNENGHRIIADSVYRALQERKLIP